MYDPITAKKICSKRKSHQASVKHTSMGERNTILSTYTLYRHFGLCCTHPPTCLLDDNDICGIPKYLCLIQNEEVERISLHNKLPFLAANLVN